MLILNTPRVARALFKDYFKDKIFIAPLYDIASTGFYNGIRNFESHLTINGKQTNIRYTDFLKLVAKAKVDKNDFKKSASKILKTYVDKMPLYIKQIAKLENIDFFIKEKHNLEEKINYPNEIGTVSIEILLQFFQIGMVKT